ncbi:polyprenyl synthetase family protein [Xylocopilactobacillus apis]|uniref:Farnesyl diphosphate synthase n=1 Tax=Xylocopilactobacillus apis TaxID=2932183 RepID=A0AAU9CQ59_9LACO|nr:polyprenyl synthetase family protein [Xylocopilactobacillus apis]BDR56077.1 farnesyl-diphosphate synthase [Xylocopilactobacillus apis]
MNSDLLKVILKFNEYLEHLYGSKEIDPKLKEAINYSLLSNGKRLRPLLFFSILNSFGINEFEHYFDIAASLEMVHTYSLIHDDLPAMDNDNLRRGKPTNHVLFGEDLAILAGDALLTDAFKVIADSKVSSDQKVSLVNALSNAAGSQNMVNGQVQDLQISDVSEENLIEMHYHKTAAMFVAASEYGAICLNLNFDQTNLLKKFAKNFGLAFQLADDLSDLDQDQSGENNFAVDFGIQQARQLKEKRISSANEALDRLSGDHFTSDPLKKFLDEYL